MGRASLGVYQAALASVTYRSTSDDPTANNTKTSRRISWTVTDADSDEAGAATTTVTSTINITPINDPPIAIAQEGEENKVTTNEDTAVAITLAGTDAENDPLTYTVVDQPSNGFLSDTTGTNLTYTPNNNYNGSDNFTFKVHDE